MIKRETYKHETPAILWSVELPEGASKGRPLAAYDEQGNSHDWDSWALEGNTLFVNFGIDPVAGELEYEYQVEGSGDGSVIIDDGANQVHITINQYGGGSSTTPTFPESN